VKPGKVLGALIGMTVGLAFGSAWLALALASVGLFLGHRADVRAEDARSQFPDSLPLDGDVPFSFSPGEPQTRSQLERESRRFFAENVAALFQEVAPPASTGREVRASAAAFLRDQLGFAPEDLARLVDINPPPLRPAVQAAEVCREELGTPERLLLLDSLFALSMESGTVISSSLPRLLSLGDALGLSEAEQLSIARLYAAGEASDYALLGISPLATDEEVKRAFRKLALEQHPDKVSYLGKTAVFRATESFRTIRQAYEAVMAARKS
jgi:DnaJ-domain-containing protein 1